MQSLEPMPLPCPSFRSVLKDNVPQRQILRPVCLITVRPQRCSPTLWLSTQPHVMAPCAKCVEVATLRERVTSLEVFHVFVCMCLCAPCMRVACARTCLLREDACSEVMVVKRIHANVLSHACEGICTCAYHDQHTMRALACVHGACVCTNLTHTHECACLSTGRIGRGSGQCVTWPRQRCDG